MDETEFNYLFGGIVIGTLLTISIFALLMVGFGDTIVNEDALDDVCKLLTRDQTATYIQDSESKFTCETDNKIHEIIPKEKEEPEPTKERIQWNKQWN